MVKKRRRGDASISHDAAAGTWALTAGGATLTLNLDSTQDFAIAGLTTSSNRAWALGTLPDTSVVVNGHSLPFGSRDAGFRLEGVNFNASGNSLSLDAVFMLRGPGLEISRHYMVTSGAP